MRPATSTLILTLAAYAAAAPSLKLTVNGPSSITDADNLAVTTTVTNTGSESVKLLNDPSTILSPWKTNSFSIKGAAGRPSFTGIKIKYSPELALKSGDDSKFTVLAPGESFKLTHDLAGIYNFTRSGAGSYNFTASNIFQYVDADGKLAVVTAETESNNFKLGGSLASLKNRPNHNRHGIARRAIGYTGCSDTRQTQIATAANSANEYVANATSYLDGISSGTERYTTWFGSFDSSRLSKVRSHYANIGTDATSTTYDCTCTEDNAYAYVFQSEPGYVYLCAAFWGAPNTGTDSRAGTIVHEQSHFTVNGDDENGGTDDHVYGQTGAQALAQSNPDQAIDNADSHEYFAENTPSLS